MKHILAALAITASLTGCVTVEEQLAADVNLCQAYGADYGSPAHYQCMLIQQQRRDQQAAAASAMMVWGANSVAYGNW